MSEYLFHPEPVDQIYLDANATTPVLPSIAEVVSHTMQICFGNPSSPHITGVQAKHLLEETRQKARLVIGAKNGDILFTSGATEGIQTAVVSTLINAKNHTLKHPVLLYGATEHKAVPNTLKHWNEVLGLNAKVLAIPVNREGILDLSFIEQHIENALMICTMAVNNETGVSQDLEALEQTIRRVNPNVTWMVDCVQALGKKALALSETSIDYAPFSGHKLYAPKGIGFLYIRDGAKYTPFIAGGGQESGMRSGTENLPGIAGLNKLFSLLLDKTDNTFKPVTVLNGYREQLKSALLDTFGDISFNHSFEYCVPTTLNFAVNDLTSKEVIDLFDAAGIRVSGGSACSTGASTSFVLDAMGISHWQSENAIRLSFGPAATQRQIDKACVCIRALKAILQSNCLIVSDSTTPHQDVCALGLTQFRHQGACSWLYVSQNKHAVIIDPIVELIPRFEKIANTQNLTIKGVLNTHEHQERSSAITLLSSVLSERLSVNDVDQLGWPCDTTHIDLDDDILEKVATPGHSPDSVSYVLKNKNNYSRFCFCGDLILPAGLGNTSLAGGDATAMAKSLLTLATQLDENSVICSGHDYKQCFAMNWAVQQSQTPLLNSLLSHHISVDEFAAKKQLLDAQEQTNKSPLCGYVTALPEVDTSQLNFDAAKKLLNEDHTYLIDTREPYEHGANDVGGVFNISDQKMLNIPLSRMANAIVEGQLQKDNKYILLCRTGNRSKVAAINLVQLGYEGVYNLHGGLALSH